MEQELPRSFMNVVARDCWFWRHMALEIPLLSVSNQDRLLAMPNDETLEPYGLAWAFYARVTAEALEQERRWLEAQAYWLAVAQFLAQDNCQSSSQYLDALTGIVRTGGYSVGMPPTTHAFEAIIDEGLQSLSDPLQRAIVMSLLMIGTIYDTVFEDLALSNAARIRLSQVLSPLQEQHIKGSHLIFKESVRVYSQLESSLHTLVDTIAAHPTLDAVKGQRNKILERLNKLYDIAIDPERTFLVTMRSLLGGDLTTYLKSPEDTLGDTYEAWKRRLSQVVEEAHALGSHLIACYLLPLLLSVDQAVYSHLLSVAHSKLPKLELQLLKPQARWHSSLLSVEFKLENHGTDIARDCTLSLTMPGTMKFELMVIEFGLLEAGGVQVQGRSVQTEASSSGLSLEGTLQWRDRLGTHQKMQIFKIEQQREIDWDALSDTAPYSTRSIQDPEKLKGRDDQLRELRLGFNSGSSFMITGQKRVGKTSLVNVFLRSLRSRENVLALYIPIGELSAASGDDLGRLGHELIRRMLEEYTDTFGTQANVELPSVEDFRASFNDPLARCLREFSKKHPEIRLAFALDDFDELPTTLFTGSVGRTLFLALRSLIDNGVSFFFIGSERLPTIMKEQAERLNQVRPLPVDYLDRSAFVALVKEPVQGNLEYTNDAISMIETWSARNPYFATLICGAIWQRAIEKRDYWITEHDVLDAVNQFVKRSSRNSYEHFWSDSPLASDDARLAYETRSTYLLLTLSKRQPNPLAYANRREVVTNSALIDKEEAELHLQELINYNVVERHQQNSELVRICVPMLTLWLKGGGAAELEQDESMKQKRRAGLIRHEELAASEVIAVIEGLSYRGRSVSADEVRVWASQFGGLDEQRLMLKLLHRLRDQGFFDQERLMFALGQLHRMVRQKAREQRFEIHLSSASHLAQNVYITHGDKVGESGSALVRSYRNQNKIPERFCGLPEKIFAAIGKNVNTRAIVVCIDDFIGSGYSATTQINNLIPRLAHHVPNWHDRVLFIYATIVGFEQGIRFIEEHTERGIAVISFKVLTEQDKAFSPDNTIFETAEDRRIAYTIAHSTGLVLQKDNPLGWEDSQALVVFPDNVPNNTLPIFYKEGAEYNGRSWRALFPRS
jgi:hypothetical protein